MYHDASTSVMLDLRRRFKAVVDVLRAVIRDGVTLAQSLELKVQWDGILRIGPVFPITMQDFDMVRNGVLGDWLQVVEGLHRRLSDFFPEVVVHRREDALRVWRNWLREDPLVHPYKWLRPDLVPPALFLQCDPLVTPGGSGVLADPARIDEEFRKAWFFIFAALGKGIPALRNSVLRLEGGFLHYLFELPRLTCQMLADVVLRKSATAGSLDGWGWREFMVLPVSWCDELPRILTEVEDLGVWPDGLLYAYSTMIPKTDGDATPLGQRPLSVLPIIYRIWASARMCPLEGWFLSWVAESVFSAGGGRSSVEARKTSALDIEEFSLVPMILTFISLLLMLSSPLRLLIGS